ncbi:chitobiase/beta-hexosaminidase C-terminal domain-containing protein [Paenibacillus sp. FSL M8-0334]|uniref:chitobiase/beta-hexosaminidase C-terminal domain-containing protein n=1 Tax=Paenibacillus sp. FSL M8-0334 TaxID=2921623 RepID=UPI0030F54DAA
MIAIAAGFYHSLALKEDETIMAWGDNRSGQLNIPTSDLETIELTDQSGRELELLFDPSKQEYTVLIDNHVTLVNVLATLENAEFAAVYVNGERQSDPAKGVNIPVTDEQTVVTVEVVPYLQKSKTYTITLSQEAEPEQVSKPVASPAGGAVLAGTTVTLSTYTNDAMIYYTTDGSTPTSSSIEYTAPIEVTTEMTIKAIAVKNGMLDSEVLEEHYTILPPDQVAKPIASPAGGAVLAGTMVTLSTTTEGATIYYTTDGSTPSRSSVEYTGPIEVTSEITIKAIAVKNGMLDSEVLEEHYTIATIPAPANLTASAADRSVTLKWDAVTGTGSVTYAVYQAEGTSVPVDPANWKLIQSNVSANSYNVTGLTNGTTYVFAVKAVSAEGASDFSNVAIATPRAPGGNSGSGGGGGGRVLSNNADLADLQVWVEGKLLKLSPSFTSGTTEYTARTEGERIEIVVKEAHSAAKVIWKGKVITDSIQVDLEEGDNTIELTVQAENGTKKTYTLTIYREMPKPNEPVIAFTDIAGHWAEDYIMRAVEKGFVSGYPDGTFEPNNPVTRAEFTVMLAGALKLEGNGSELTFTDHDRIGGWAKQAVAQAVQAGIVDGYNDGSFRPNAQITRVEMAAMIARALQLQLNANASTGFADDEAIPQWAKGAVEAIRKLGIVDGRGGNRFVPNETATRAEATVMLLRLLDR